MNQKRTVIFGILNWGLGHASRSIPIIKYLQSQDYNVIVCTDGHVIDFLRKEIPDFNYEILPAYNMHYRYHSMALNMLLQSPKLYLTYLKEKRVFRKLEEKYKPVFCISDNRYGCIAKNAPSFFISHQWNILGSSQKKHPLASRLNQYFIRKYKALLIPDDPVLNITGKLTRDLDHTHYDLGMISRFSIEENKEEKKTIQCLAILSGPEPKRTQLEVKLCGYFEKNPNAQFALTRGTEKKPSHAIPSNVIVYNIADKKKILELINQSEVLLCRSGYSSIMDYLMLDLKRIIFIPTPGQTEQEYLAERLRVFHGYECLKESECTINNLERVIDQVRELEATERTKISINSSHFHKVLDRAIEENI